MSWGLLLEEEEEEQDEEARSYYYWVIRSGMNRRNPNFWFGLFEGLSRVGHSGLC